MANARMRTPVLLVLHVLCHLVLAAKNSYTLNVGVVQANYTPTYGFGVQAQSYLATMGMLMAVETVNNSTTILPTATISVKQASSAAQPGGSDAAIIDLIMNQNCVALFGDPTSDLTSYSATLSSSLGFPQVCVTCNATALSNGQYPLIVRMEPMGAAVAAMQIAQSFNWTKMAVLYSVESDSLDMLNWALGAQGNINLLSSQVAELGPAFASIQNEFARIIFLIGGPAYTDIVFYAAAAYGLTGPGYVWITVTPLGQTLLPASIDAYFGAGTSAQSVGVLTPTFQKHPNVLTTATYTSFYNRYSYFVTRNMNSVAGTDAPNVNWFDSTGIPSDIAIRAYDAAMAIFTTWDAGLRANNLTPSAIATTFGPVTPAMITATGYQGVNGLFVLDPMGSAVLPGYIKQISSVGTTVVYSAIANYSTSSINMTSSPTWSGGGSSVPLDYPVFTFDQLSYVVPETGLIDGLSIFIAVLFALSICISVVSLVFMIYLKRHPLVMKRGPLFNSILLVGLCLWGVQSVIDIANVGSNTWICYIQPWLMGLGFSLVTSSICVKAWRLWCIFDNAKLVRRNLSDSFLLTITGVFCLTETILLAVNHGMNPQSVTVTQIGLRKLQLCTPNNTSVSSGTIGALYALNGIFLLLCVFLAYKTRNVPRQFGEALETSISVYTIVLACIIILPNVGSNTQSLRERSVIRLFVQWFCLTVIQHMLISPILMVVYKETHAGTIGSSVMTQSKSTGSAAANRVRGAEDYKLSDKKLAFEEFSFIWKDTGSFFPQKWKKINCIICRAPENPFLVFEDSKNPKEKGFIVTIAAINGLLFTDSNEKTLALTWSAGSFLLTARPGTNIQEWYSAVSEMISEVRASMQEDSAKTAAGAKGSAAKTKASKG